jgi:hypothetical protein
MHSVRTHSNQGSSSVTASSATNFLFSTDDPLLTVTTAPTPCLDLGFRGNSATPFAIARKGAAQPIQPPPERMEPLRLGTPREPPPLETPPLEPSRPEISDDDPEPEARPASHRIELIIDSLPHHTLIEPIPVVIVPLGDKVFTASVLNNSIHATGTSIGEALLVLKEQIEEIYADLNKRLAHLDTEQKETLQLLHTYISVQPRRQEWL